MIQLVMRPMNAPVVNREKLYMVVMNGTPLGLTVRAANGNAACEKLMFVFSHELEGKNLDFDIRKFKERRDDEGRGEPGA